MVGYLPVTEEDTGSNPAGTAKFMKCPSIEVGRDGTREHSGSSFTIEISTCPKVERFTVCENHRDSYLLAPYCRQV